MIHQTNQKLGDFECEIVRHQDLEKPEAVVILCHGFGAPSSDLVGLAGEFIKGGGEKAVYVFPAAPIKMDELFDSRAWWMIDIEKIQQLMMNGETREMRNESPELLPERRESMIRLIDLCRVDFQVEPHKIIVGGFSQGAMLTCDVALHYREQLGGLIVWSGALINEPVWAERSKSQQTLTVVQSHGRIDPILPFSSAEELRDMLEQDGHLVRFSQFNGQHSIPREAIESAWQLICEVVVRS